MTITELSIKRPILIIVAFLAIALVGLFAYSTLKYETFPSMSVPVITVVTTYSGASANVVESTITKTIEDAVSGVNDVDYISSTSQEGTSTVSINFLSNANIDVAAQDVQNKINQILSSLPDAAGTPSIMKISMDDMPVMRIGATSNMESRDFYQFLDDQIKPQLNKVKGVGQVSFVGETEREIRVNINSRKMAAYGMSTATITNAISKANLDYPTGKVKDSDGQYVLRLAGKFSSLEELKSLVISKSDNGIVTLGDVADVNDGTKDQSTINRVDGQRSVGLSIRKQSDANEVEVCRSIRKTVQMLEEQYKDKNLKFNITEDGSTYTIDSANAVKEDLVLAIVLVALVMLLFLHSMRNALIVMVAIPTSLVATFIGMWATGCTINIITLLALSLVIGILVDDSIVVLENIHHHLEIGEDKKLAALNGRNEIGFTALSITLVDVAVFLPLALVSGMIGGIMHQFALVIVFSTLMSLVVSFTVTPMLASRFSKMEQLSSNSLMGRFGIWFEKQYQRMVDFYLDILDWGLENRGRVLLMVGILFILVVALIPGGFIGTEFMATADKGELTVQIELAPKATLEQTDQITKKVETILWKVPEVEKMFTSVGTSSSMMSSSTSASNNAEIEVVLTDKAKRKRTTDEVSQDIKDRLGIIPGITTHVNAAGATGGSNSPIQYVVLGTNWNTVEQTAQQIKKLMAKVPGTKDIYLSSEVGQPEVRVQVDREKMAKFGLSIDDIGSILESDFSGDDSTKYRDADGSEYTIRVMYDEADRSRTDDLSGVTFVNSAGQTIQLNQFAALINATGPTKLERQDRNYAITIKSQAVGRTSGSISSDINRLLQKAKLPQGVSWKLGGMLKNQGEAFSSLGLALLAAIIFVYFIMTALYDSFIYPFTVLFAIPLALIGALLGLGLSGNSLSIFSILAIIMQIGLVSKNAILLVDFANRSRAEGASIKEALLAAGRERIRPILMTTLTMILGMLPLALSSTSGAEYKNGMGWALIGGLTSSMLMTLVVVPIIYTIIEQLREKLLVFQNKRHRSI
ncbi:MAG TPA: acriflavin resistance protein [Firmicutes bacterium]|jgi:hydrophobic/amphiphilic exporter-1 (mainly G- bacteria), HAE1 family|nr:acriflavin resistance protein [Bacillota bacterium]